MPGSVPTPAPNPKDVAPYPLLYVVGRYALFQLPELVIVCGALVAAVEYEVIPHLWGWLLVVALFPFVRTAYEPSDPRATSAMIGKIAVVVERLDPRGTVRLGPELWAACLEAGLDPVDAGGRVCVKAVEGLTLRVEASPG